MLDLTVIGAHTGAAEFSTLIRSGALVFDTSKSVMFPAGLCTRYFEIATRDAKFCRIFDWTIARYRGSRPNIAKPQGPTRRNRQALDARE